MQSRGDSVLGAYSTAVCPERPAISRACATPSSSRHRWAFGILLFEILTGCPPFDDTNAMGIYKKILGNRLVYPVTIKGLSRALVAKLLVTAPHKRLGGGKLGAQEVMEDAFFAEYDFQKLANKEYEPPILPSQVEGLASQQGHEEATASHSSIFIDSASVVSAEQISRLDGAFGSLAGANGAKRSSDEEKDQFRDKLRRAAGKVMSKQRGAKGDKGDADADAYPVLAAPADAIVVESSSTLASSRIPMARSPDQGSDSKAERATTLNEVRNAQLTSYMQVASGVAEQGPVDQNSLARPAASPATRLSALAEARAACSSVQSSSIANAPALGSDQQAASDALLESERRLDRASSPRAHTEIPEPPGDDSASAPAPSDLRV